MSLLIRSAEFKCRVVNAGPALLVVVPPSESALRDLPQPPGLLHLMPEDTQ